VFTSEVGPVIGTYTGPGLIGVGAIPRALLA
jgi:fatty acid-binding protein DegV